MSSGDERPRGRAAPSPPPEGVKETGGGPAFPCEHSRLNACTVERELAWFEQVLQARTDLYFHKPSAPKQSLDHIDPPGLASDESEYARVVRHNEFGFAERLVLVLALIPHVRPQALDPLFVRNKNFDRGFAEFGGWKGKAHGGFLPTGETAAFLLAGDDVGQRIAAVALFESDHAFRRKGILRLEHDAPGEPFFSASLVISDEYLERLTTGRWHKPDFSGSFPAKLITTSLGWHDLVLADDVLQDVHAINAWIRHAHTLLHDWGLERCLKPGYRSLFYGPPGTGKTLTATIIGQTARADVYRIDLSMVVSKYIGETEKNLANVFDQAQSRRWILFFDEADALFGKRGAATTANDHHANQEIAYLLQRVEDFPGTVILATNLKANIDEAFARRFQSLVYFPMPDAEQRLRLWQGMLGDRVRLDKDVDLNRIAEDHELSGGAIANVVRYAAIQAVLHERHALAAADLRAGVAKELRKEGRTV